MSTPPREGGDRHARHADRPRRPAVPAAVPPSAARILPRMLGFRGNETPPETAPAPPADDAQYWIRRLGLRAHPEGGYYRETYRASEQLGRGQLPERFEGARAISTAIYFLLEGQQRSLIHRIRSDEVWHFYAGDPLVLFVFEQQGGMRRVVLGRDLEDQQTLQAVVPAETWFGAALVDGGRYALVGCTVAPGFAFADFETGERRALLDLYPQHQLAVKRLTR